MKKNNQGFTLVELAIVLVIIGLLVGGVLQGQELIKQAQIRGFVSQVTGYDAALNTFRSKYRGLPGDTAKSTSFGLDTNSALTGVGKVGNGDGMLQSVTSPTQSYASYGGEVANFWVHLADSKMIKGSYICAAAADCAANPLAGNHFPSASVGAGIIAVSSGTNLYYLTGLYSGFDGAAGMTVTANNSTGASVLGLALSQSEAFAIDSKMDDGKPIAGVVQTIATYGGATSAINATVGATAAAGTAGVCGANSNADYNLTATDSPSCSLSIKASM